MKNAHLTHKLVCLTASLQANTKTSKAELSKIRKLLIQHLDQEKDSLINVSEQAVEVQIDQVINEVLTGDLAESILEEMDQSVSKTLKKTRKETSAQPLIFRRALPFSSSSASRLSAPEWVGNLQVDQTIGPFYDALNRPFWFDIIFPVRQISLLRQSSSQPILQLPLRGFILGSATEYTIPAGSIWILSRLLASNAPANAYSGMRITGGKLQLSSAPNVIGNNFEIGNNVKVTLTLMLDHPAATGPQAGPGKDAMNSKIEPPSKVIFVFTNGGAKLDEASSANVSLFGNALELKHTNEAASYSPLLERVLLPFKVLPGTLNIDQAASDFFSLSGKSGLKGGFWTLDTSTLPPNSLGEAVNAGGIAIHCEKGIQANWKGLQLGPISLPEPYFLLEPNTLSVFAKKVKKNGAGYPLKLWKNKEQGNQYSEANILFDNESTLKFISIAGEADAMLVTGVMEASIDKPVKADCNHIPLYASLATVLVYQNSNGANILIYGNLTSKETRMSLALSNGLFVTTPPGIFYLFGKTTDFQSIEDGGLLLFFGVRNLIPALKDPYTSNYPLIDRYSQRDQSLSARSPISVVLLALVNWNNSEDAELSMILAKNTGFYEANAGATSEVGNQAEVSSNEAVMFTREGNVSKLSLATTEESAGSTSTRSFYSTETAFIAQGVNIKEVLEEDEAAKTQLTNIFRKTAGNGLPQIVLLDVSTNIDHLGVGYGVGKRNSSGTNISSQQALPVQIQDLELVATGDSLRLFLLPQFQWEPVQNIPNPNIGFFPPSTASNNDGGPTIIGSNTVTLVPFAPEKVVNNIVEEFNRETNKRPAAGLFTLPFGMIASARFQPEEAGSTADYATLQLVQPSTADGAFKGGIQLSARSFSHTNGPTVQSPSFPGATYQTRNLVDPQTSFPWGISVLKGDLVNDGVEAFFNNEMGPGSPNAKVPLTRIDFSGYGASAFSEWKNPNAVAAISKVHFETIVGRTGHEVVQVASIMYPFSVPMVRTITLQRRKEAIVIRSDSGWVAVSPGVYQYPDPDPASNPGPPPGWTKIQSHPGLVKGCYNVRRARETGRVVTKDILVNGINTTVELLEVKYDADFEVEGVINGQGDDGRVTSIDAVGYLQRLPSGYPLAPEQLAEIMEEEGSMGADINCTVELVNSGQTLRVKRIEVDATYAAVGSIPQFAVAARGALDLPNDGEWTVLRHDLSKDEPELLSQSRGVPVVRQGLVNGGSSIWLRIAEPSDLLQPDNPSVEFGLTQSSKGHKIFFPRPRIKTGNSHIESTQRPFLADGYALSSSTGVFPKKNACFVGNTPFELHIDGGGRYTLGPVPTMDFIVPPQISNRDLVNSAAFKIITKYSGPVSYTLDPNLPESWGMEVADVLTTMDLGPFSEIMGISHKYIAGAISGSGLANTQMIYAPLLQPIVEIMTVLTELLGIDNQLEVETSEGSFKFKATLNLPIEDPNAEDGYFDLGAMKVKGKLQIGIHNDPWTGFMEIGLGAQVPVLPPIFGGGEIKVGLTGNELSAEQVVNIKFIWNFSLGKSLGPIEVSGKFYFGIELIISTGGTFQIGLLVGISATADIIIIKITVKLELMAAIKRIPDATPTDPSTSSKVEAIGKAKFAAEVSVCWFLTISVSYTLEYKDEISI